MSKRLLDRVRNRPNPSLDFWITIHELQEAGWLLIAAFFWLVWVGARKLFDLP